MQKNILNFGRGKERRREMKTWQIRLTHYSILELWKGEKLKRGMVKTKSTLTSQSLCLATPNFPLFPFLFLLSVFLHLNFPYTFTHHAHTLAFMQQLLFGFNLAIKSGRTGSCSCGRPRSSFSADMYFVEDEARW